MGRNMIANHGLPLVRHMMSTRKKMKTATNRVVFHPTCELSGEHAPVHMP